VVAWPLLVATGPSRIRRRTGHPQSRRPCAAREL